MKAAWPEELHPEWSECIHLPLCQTQNRGVGFKMDSRCQVLCVEAAQIVQIGRCYCALWTAV